ncbi:MAG: LEA type 2 family protein [Bacteroidales bacterium]|nr:LEA type 2 family protein [Bacteroidales bacterium]
MNRFRLIFLSFVVITGLFGSCSITDQITEVRQFSQCNFYFQKVSDVHLTGIPLVEGMKRSDLNAGQMMQLTAALFAAKLPLDFDIWLKATNPNDKNASLNRMDYEVYLDGNKLITGSLDEPIYIPAKDSSKIKIPIGADLFQVLSGKSSDAVVNLGFRISGSESKQTEVEIRIKPYIKVGLYNLAYPGFISLKKKI